MEQTENKKIDFKTLAGIVVGIVVMVLVQQFFFKSPSFDKQMMQVASELNKTCPIMVDAETRLDNAVALPDKIFTYNYTLINQVKDSLNVEELKNYLTPLVTNSKPPTSPLNIGAGCCKKGRAESMIVLLKFPVGKTGR